ncbi:YolD-like family protein [Alkalihalophilus pseudofirmus]|uniref:YolD-like family protein n=1 Tax=Alkalihalophilus pseudofirmus TaxID=79885 RepID=A0AAJ2TZX7_ALKPS|nr:YolD-like family protein [Alkalihalophilus pseudofirmus]MDV2885524.1 YolD-like family protein [Alkalihalophilus pseudofirmus]
MRQQTEERLQRGNLLWEGSRFLLPEHKEAILPLFKDNQPKEKPLIDDQTIHEMERVIGAGLKRHIELYFSYWENGTFKTIVGEPIRIDQLQKRLYIKDSFHETQLLDLTSLVDVRSNH